MTWLACDLRTGAVIEELAALVPGGSLQRRLGHSTSLSCSLPLAGAPSGWEGATEKGRTLLVCISDAGVPAWPGMVMTRNRGSASSVSLGLATPEAYLDRRYVGDHAWEQVDEASVIAAGLFADAQPDGIGLTIDAPATGTLRDRTYADADDKTMLSALTDLMGVQDGPEWMIDCRWRDSKQTSVELVARVRKKIGVQPAMPAAVFDLPGCVTVYEQAESYENGKGANVVRAYGDGEGDTRAVSDPAEADDLIASGWPRYEYRWTPSSSIVQTDTLNGHASSALALMATGASVWTFTASTLAAPQLGVDWGLGDNVRLSVAPGRSAGHPDGVEVVARAWGWDWDTRADTITPILVEEG